MAQIIEFIINVIEERNFNLLNCLFTCLSAFAIISFWESKLPDTFRKFVRYGKHQYKGVKTKSLPHMDVPKSWFRHFYIFAFSLNVWSMYLVAHVVILGNSAPEYVTALLDFVAGGSKNRQVVIDSTSTVVANALMFLQILRRFYESNFMQIFSEKNKINLIQYLVGYIHYLCVILVLLANSEGFVRVSVSSTFNLVTISYGQFVCIAIFLFSWWHQHKSNLILVDLRRNCITGRVTKEAHLLPHGGFFEWVSSPHMFFEILLYAALLGFMAKIITWWLIVIWVASNQIIVALFTHSFYKETFKMYPKNRKAIIPFIL